MLTKIDTLVALLFLMLLLLALSTPVSAEPHFTFCHDTMTNYSLNSPFEDNLKNLLDNISYSTPHNKGFYNTSIGNDTNQVYGQALCRGDVTPRVCQNCVENVSLEIMEECKSQAAVIWYEKCQIQYSYRMFFNTLQPYTFKFPDWNNQMRNVSDPVPFSAALTSFMKNLSTKAEIDPSKLMFATGNIKFSRIETIYGLVQCTRDISPTDCSGCLNSALTELEGCCNYRQGETIFSRNCNVRFELYRFFDDSTGNEYIW
ncbi:cysteine-rich repeat secretory protein 38-like [Cornus florida]|uniref:cysteine-rich repeat secretory protein 38-like n=1 Tax=Cornus florida TaxID=4283 RepID=UPI00289EC182|nr:cysteine-rich repeat secretory protein 38-like [Cornus florida]